MLHGCTQIAADFAAGTRMGERAAEEAWLTLFPEQLAGAHPQRCWRWFEPDHQSADAGEPALLMAMLGEVIAERRVDPGRVYLAGISAGGAMAAVLAATRPDRFAGVAIHSGVPYGAARGPEEAMEAMAGGGPDAAELGRRLREALDGRPPPPLLVIHGEQDQAVAPVNARRLTAAWLAATGRGVPDEAGGSDRLPEPALDESHAPNDSRSWRLRAWTGPGPRVELRTVEGLGHAWSGGDPTGTYTDPKGPSATEWAVEFFRRSSAGERREGSE
jgi:poly(hydroxyalkanoate) depolymerase family esterase